jgi:Fur family transcriptional regulator, ferric uptake regulator
MTAKAQAQTAELLRARGVRVTSQRLEVLAELGRERDDVTAQALWGRLRARGSQTGLATVYRTLSLLNEKGVIDALSHHGTELCYRLCSDTHHHHLVCSTCHSVVEIDQCGLDDWLAEVAARHSFVLTEHRVEVTGVCSSCR